MRITLLYIGALILLLCPCKSYGQINPDNPPEPNVRYKYKLVVKSNPEDIAWNSGDGKYEQGEEIWVNSSPNYGGYTLTHWTMNGVKIGNKDYGFVFTMPAMLLSWTPAGSDMILGLQGRYFLPVLPLIFFVFTKFSVRVRTDSSRERITGLGRKYMIWFAALSCLCVYFMMRLYLTR